MACATLSNGRGVSPSFSTLSVSGSPSLSLSLSLRACLAPPVAPPTPTHTFSPISFLHFLYIYSIMYYTFRFSLSLLFTTITPLFSVSSSVSMRESVLLQAPHWSLLLRNSRNHFKEPVLNYISRTGHNFFSVHEVKSASEIKLSGPIDKNGSG